MTRIPSGIYHDLVATEVDTVDDSSPEAKHVLADEMQRAQAGGTIFRVPLSDESKYYLLDQALPNIFNIAEDNMDRRKMNSIKKFYTKLYDKLIGSDE